MKTCNECKNALFEDFGYSNYTVEGTEFFCMVRAHPEDGFDRWFGEDERLNFAEQCPSFHEGPPIKMDVEHDEKDDLTDEQKKQYEEFNRSRDLALESDE